MKLNNDKFFKDFNDDYILFIYVYYKNKSISYIKKDIKKQIDILQNKNNLKRIMPRNINYWIIRGWSIEDTELKIQKIKNNWKKPKYSILNFEYWIDKGFSIESAKLKTKELQKGRGAKAAKTRLADPNHIKKVSPFTEEFWINKGFNNKDEIKIKINSQRKNNINYWINKGFDEIESKIKVSEYQKENSQKSIKNWQCKKGTYEYRKKQVTNVEYYIDKGFSIEESKKLLKERQTTFTLETCITKYGEIEGKEIHANRQQKWQKSLLDGGNLKCGFSKISQDLFYSIMEYYNDNENQDDIYFATKNKEYYICKGKDEFYQYDFVDLKNKKIIEYNGDQYHANPNLYDANDTPHPFRKNITSQDIWNKDESKRKAAEERDFEVLTIWDSEYKKHKDETLEKCKTFLNL